MSGGTPWRSFFFFLFIDFLICFLFFFCFFFFSFFIFSFFSVFFFYLLNVKGVGTDVHPVTRTEQEEGTIYSLIFRKTRIAKYADVRTLRPRHAQEIQTIGRTELKLLKDLVI